MKNLRGQGLANTYRATHHLCEHQDVPRDKDGLPKKCAMPMGEGTPFDLLKKGKIGWKDCLHWMVFKMESDWMSGMICLTIQQVKEWLRFSNKTLCDIRKSLQSVGLLERLSKPFKAFSAQLYPKPYEKRCTRRRENPKGMPTDGTFYYSYNGLWRLSREDGQIQTLIEGTSTWWDANEFECEQANSKIHADFMKCSEAIGEVQDAPFMKARA